jgi:SecD/SecF fusion protein
MSEYIPRLRQELVDAAAREHAGQRRRPGVRPARVALVLAAAVVAAAVVLAVQAIQIVDDDRPVASLPPGTALSYRVAPVPGGDPATAAERSAEVLRERIAAAGVDGATVSVAGDRVGVDVDGSGLGTVAALAVPGRLAIYDWETSVLGPDGRPVPGDESVTGGPGAGQVATVSQYEAVARAAKARSADGPAALWLVDDTAQKVLAGPQWTREAITGGGAVPAGARVVEVPGGVRVVRAEGAGPGRFYVLGDGAALGNAEISRARAETDPGTGDPIVAFDFTSSGRSAFHSLTREIAQRGSAAARPGDDPLRTSQHMAIVLDDRLVAVPFIHYKEVPDGIDGKSGAQISGGLSSQRAEQIATILNTGPMPATLAPDAP